jgi:hypothetical protein
MATAEVTYTFVPADGDDEREFPVLAQLREILEPLGRERVNVLVAWARDEMRQHPIVQYCWDGRTSSKTAEDGTVYQPGWELGEESPIAPGHTIFAMFYWEGERLVVAYTFQWEKLEAGTAVQFYREMIFQPVHVNGPATRDALFHDLAAFIGPEPEPDETNAGEGEHEQANGEA